MSIRDEMKAMCAIGDRFIIKALRYCRSSPSERRNLDIGIDRSHSKPLTAEKKDAFERSLMEHRPHTAELARAEFSDCLFLMTSESDGRFKVMVYSKKLPQGQQIYWGRHEEDARFEFSDRAQKRRKLDGN